MHKLNFTLLLLFTYENGAIQIVISITIDEDLLQEEDLVLFSEIDNCFDGKTHE